MYQCRSEGISACIFPSNSGILSRGFAPLPGRGYAVSAVRFVACGRRRVHGEAE